MSYFVILHVYEDIEQQIVVPAFVAVRATMDQANMLSDQLRHEFPYDTFVVEEHSNRSKRL